MLTARLLTRQAHTGDLFVPLSPETLADRLGAIGFSDVRLDHGESDIRFCARKHDQGAC